MNISTIRVGLEFDPAKTEELERLNREFEAAKSALIDCLSDLHVRVVTAPTKEKPASGN